MNLVGHIYENEYAENTIDETEMSIISFAKMIEISPA